MYYSIASLCPRTDIDMGRHGFQINLHPKFKELAAASGMTQEMVNQLVKTCGDSWLDACGYDGMSDYAGDGVKRRVWEARSIRVSWGDWGPEHISVPGNACGLDLDQHCFGNPLRGPGLLPHNVDSWPQVQLLLIVFTTIVDHMISFAYDKLPELNQKRRDSHGKAT